MTRKYKPSRKVFKRKTYKSKTSSKMVDAKLKSLVLDSTNFGRLKGPFQAYVKGDPFPPAIKRTLHYTESYSFTTGSVGVLGTAVQMNLNSLYDPNASGVGHQPYGFDQVAALYRVYKVTGVTVELKWTNPSADGLVCVAMTGSQGLNYALAGRSHDEVSELPFTVTRILNDSGSQNATVRQYFPMYTLLGVTPNQFSSDVSQYQAAVTASPAAMPKLKMAVGSIVGETGATVQCKVTLKFHSVFYDRIVQDQS